MSSAVDCAMRGRKRRNVVVEGDDGKKKKPRKNVVVYEMPVLFEETDFKNKESIQASLPADLHLVSRIGAGTFGTVYRVLDGSEGANCALKLLHRDPMDQGMPLTAVREAALLRTLQPHKNIVKLGRVIFTDKAIGFVLELCAMDLHSYLARKRRLDAAEQQGFARQILEVVLLLFVCGFNGLLIPFVCRACPTCILTAWRTAI